MEPLTRSDLLTALARLTQRDLATGELVPNSTGRCDAEGDHAVADGLLARYIGDPEITAAYARVAKWYA